LNPLAELDPAFLVTEPGLSLMLVIATNTVAGRRQRFANRGVDLTRPFQPSVATQHERLGASAVEALRILEDSLVTPLTHSIENRAHVGLDASEIFVAAPAQRR
jgi:hypothetical protein